MTPSLYHVIILYGIPIPASKVKGEECPYIFKQTLIHCTDTWIRVSQSKTHKY